MKFKIFLILILVSHNLFSQSNYSAFIKLKRLFLEEKYNQVIELENDTDKKMNFIPILFFTKLFQNIKLIP